MNNDSWISLIRPENSNNLFLGTQGRGQMWHCGYFHALKKVLNLGSAAQYPKLAILQLNEGEAGRNYRFESLVTLKKYIGETPSSANYELIFVEHAPTAIHGTPFLEETFRRFNADCPRPATYYGHSLSVSDVVVIATSPTTDPTNMAAYYVDDFGFEPLDDFLMIDTMERINLSMDIRTEYEACKALQNNNLEQPDYFTTRRHSIEANYQTIFELADKRHISEFTQPSTSSSPRIASKHRGEER